MLRASRQSRLAMQQCSRRRPRTDSLVQVAHGPSDPGLESLSKPYALVGLARNPSELSAELVLRCCSFVRSCLLFQQCGHNRG
jgi:hypothetical protein